MSKLIIDPQKLADIRAAIDALDAAPATEELPAKVKAFWFHEERSIPALTVRVGRRARGARRGSSRGCWTG
jgi:hypothetical protein